MKTLPDDGTLRKNYPISGGCIAYFPAALAGVSKHSYIGGAKYNNGALLHLRWLGGNNLDCVGRHILDIQDLMAARDRGTTHTQAFLFNFETKKEEWVTLPIEDAILIECNALSWRSLAVSQELHEQLGGAPLAPAARVQPAIPTYQPIRMLEFGHNKVSTIKAMRAINGYSLKEAVDLVNALPALIDYDRGEYTRIQALGMLKEAGASVE